MEAPLSRPPHGDIKRGVTLVVLCALGGLLFMATFAMRIGIRTLNRQLAWDDFTITVA